MLVYLFLALFILFLFTFSRKKKKQVYNVIIFLMCFFGLFRGRSVGLDVDKYCLNISRTTFNPSTWNYHPVFEDGYNILIAVYNTIFDNPLFFVGLCNVFFVLAWNHYNKKKNERFEIGLLALYLLGYYIQSYNIIRQYFALGLMLLILAKIDLENMKLKDHIILTVCIWIVGTLFHNSVYILMLIPIYYIIKSCQLYNKMTCFILIATSAIVFYLDIISNALGVFSDLFFINEKTNGYYQSALIGNVEEEEYSFLRIILDNTFLLFLLFRAKSIGVFAYLYIAGQLFINLFSPLNTLFVRISCVLFIVGIPFIVSVWDSGNRLDKLFILIYAAAIFINLLVKNYGLAQPYVFCFE